MKQNSILFKRFSFRGRQYVCLQVDADFSLNVKTIYAVSIPARSTRLPNNFLNSPRKRITGKELSEVKILSNTALAGRYYPAAESPCKSLDLITPDSMDYETEQALLALKKEIGDLNEFACSQLRCTPDELESFLSAEQVDAVCMAIHAIQNKGGFILGDQTGVGKGRVAAAIIRYAVENNEKAPLFFTIKPNLFSDIYRDLKALGCAHYKPYIINNTNSDIIDENGEVVYRKSKKFDKNEVDYILCTYSQINSEKISGQRRAFISELADNAVCILDESHSASGTSNTTKYMYSVLSQKAKGVLFLSATFAKRPDNMLLYCSKTKLNEIFSISKNEAPDGLSEGEEIEKVFKSGGIPLQEYVSSQLVASGQMLRRERSFKGVQVEYVTLDASAKEFGLRDYSKEHFRAADAVTRLIQRIILFQTLNIKPIIDSYNKENRQSYYNQKGRAEVGMRNSNLFSRLFHIVDTFLFSLKAEAAADLTISRINKGEKVVIAFSKTNESLLDSMRGNIKNDLSQLLLNALDSTLYVTDEGERIKLELEGSDIAEHKRIQEEIKRTFRAMTTYLPASPIDYIVERLEQEGIVVAELTGRNVKLVDNKIERREKLNVSKAFQDFNNNFIDVLLINQTASTGASAHAITTDLVPIEKVKKRCMIVLQSELDINTEIQKRGRINRTGQVVSPLYIYLHSAIPAERRISMMLQAKLKSLDANTTSSQKNTEKNENVEHDDFINKYGDGVVAGWLVAHGKTAKLLGYENLEETPEGIARQATGRVAILSTKEQEEFYRDVLKEYNEQIDYLKAVGQYDLEMVSENLQAKTLRTIELLPAKDGRKKSGLSGSVFLEECEVNNLRKPYNSKTVVKIVQEEIKHLKEQFGTNNRGGYDTDAILQKVSTDYTNYFKDNEPQNTTSEAKRLQSEKTTFKHSLEQLRVFLGKYNVGDVLRFHPDKVLNTVDLAVLSSIRIGETATPSTIKIGFIVANDMRSITVTAEPNLDSTVVRKSGTDSKDECKKLYFLDFEAYNPSSILSDDMQKKWDSEIASFQANRVIRYILTGSLLRAYNTKFKDLQQPKIISYTTIEGDEKKGCLFPKTHDKKIKNEYFGSENTKPKELELNSVEFFNYFQKTDNHIQIFNRKVNDAISITIYKGYGGLMNINVYFSKKKDVFWIVKDPELMSLTSNGDGFRGGRKHLWTSVYKDDISTTLNRLHELGCYATVQEQVDAQKEKEIWTEAEKARKKKTNRITPILKLELQAFLKGNTVPYTSPTVDTPRDALAQLARLQCSDSTLQPLYSELERITSKFSSDAKLDSSKYSMRSELRAHDVRASMWLKANKTIDRSEVDVLVWLANQLQTSKKAAPKITSDKMAKAAAITRELALKISKIQQILQMND